MGTIPQWICAVALVLIVIILGTHWSGFSAEWVTAVATAMLAFAALIGLGGVLVPLQIERGRRRTMHLDRLVAVVLQPIRMELESQYELKVARRHSPLYWTPELDIHEYKAPGASLPFAEETNASPPDESDLFKALYTDIKEKHYPSLIADYEQYCRDYKNLVDALIVEAKDIKSQLHVQCSLNNTDISDPNGRGVHFGYLALYIFSRLWLVNYQYPLSVRIVGQDLAQLNCENTGSYYANGTKEELEVLNRTVEELIHRHRPLESIEIADRLVPRLTAIDTAIAQIRVNGSLEGDCAATKSKHLLA